MAFDGALLDAVAGRDVAGVGATVRTYGFTPPGLSLGWFQRLVDVPRAREMNAVARRLTGGGAIHHHRELTFAIAASADHPLYRGDVAGSYRRVHAAIADVLRDVGIRAELRADRALASDTAGTGLCFHASSSLDLVWPRRGDGALAKGVGSAQRRRTGRVLHHGSIKLSPDPEEPGVATVWPLPDPARERELEEALVTALGELLGGGLEPCEPHPSEVERALETQAWHADRHALQRRPSRR